MQECSILVAGQEIERTGQVGRLKARLAELGNTPCGETGQAASLAEEGLVEMLAALPSGQETTPYGTDGRMAPRVAAGEAAWPAE